MSNSCAGLNPDAMRILKRVNGAATPALFWRHPAPLTAFRAHVHAGELWRLLTVHRG